MYSLEAEGYQLSLRSLGSLVFWLDEDKKTGHNKNSTEDCMNVINPTILYKDADSKTLLQELVPPPVNWICIFGQVLMKSKNILQRSWNPS